MDPGWLFWRSVDVFSRRKQKGRPVGQETNMKGLGERKAKPTGGFQPRHVGTGSPCKDIRRALCHFLGQPSYLATISGWRDSSITVNARWLAEVS